MHNERGGPGWPQPPIPIQSGGYLVGKPKLKAKAKSLGQCEKGNISGIFRHCQVERARSAGIYVFYANLWPRQVSFFHSFFFLFISEERHLNEADLAQTFPLLFRLMIYKPRVITTDSPF